MIEVIPIRRCLCEGFELTACDYEDFPEWKTECHFDNTYWNGTSTRPWGTLPHSGWRKKWWNTNSKVRVKRLGWKWRLKVAWIT